MARCPETEVVAEALATEDLETEVVAAVLETEVVADCRDRSLHDPAAAFRPGFDVARMAKRGRSDDQIASRWEKTGENPTDRGKLGTKRSVLTDGCGVPLDVEVSGANTHDIKLLQATFDSVPIRRPQPTSHRHQHVCLDKGYDSKDVRRFLRRRYYQPHVKSRGQEQAQKKSNPRFKARRWVVERTHSWINRFCRLLVRWEKKADNYLAMLHFSFA